MYNLYIIPLSIIFLLMTDSYVICDWHRSHFVPKPDITYSAVRTKKVKKSALRTWLSLLTRPSGVAKLDGETLTEKNITKRWKLLCFVRTCLQVVNIHGAFEFTREAAVGRNAPHESSLSGLNTTVFPNLLTWQHWQMSPRHSWQIVVRNAAITTTYV